MDFTQEEYAKRAIDLIGLEYPADIDATYKDLPTTLPELLKLQYHLHTLFNIGEQTNNDDLADYALFANSHVRYRMLVFEREFLSPSDAYYLRAYESKLPRMKWNPLSIKEHDETILPFFDTEMDLGIVLPFEVEQATPVEVEHHEMVKINSPVVHDDSIEKISSMVNNCVPHMRPEPPICTTPAILPGRQSFSCAYSTYRTRIGSDLIIRSVHQHRIWTTRLTLKTMDEFNIFAVSYYGIPTRIVCDDAAYLASLFHSITGRFCGYESAGYYISATTHTRKGPSSLMSLALYELSKAWLTAPPLRRSV